VNFVRHFNRLCFSLVCAAWAAAAGAANEEEFPVPNTNDFTFVIHASLPPFRCHLVHDTNYPPIPAIEVFRGDGLRPWQILTNGLGELTWGGQDQLVSLDANFDGYKDLEGVNFWGATGNISYNLWLFDTNTGRFEFSSELSELCSPEFVSAEKKITTHAKGGRGIYMDDTYIWEHGQLRLVQQYSQDYESRPVRDWLRDHLKWKRLNYDPELLFVERVWTNGTWKVKSGRVPPG
jgi:hypothetical protein